MYMSNDLCQAAMCGDIDVIENTVSDEHLHRKTFVANNIIHIAIRNGNMFFVRKALERVPHLLWEPNTEGDTPLHVAAEMGHKDFVRQICDELKVMSPLRMQNSMGNTPLHVALVHNKYEVAKMLVEKDPSLASTVNFHAEAPLHLAIKHFPDDGDDDSDEWSDWRKRRCISSLEEKRTNWNEEYFVIDEEKMVTIIVLLLEKASNVAGWCDASGLTPLHEAASLHKSINLHIVAFVIRCCPQSMEVRDSSGRTILHHLINKIANLSDGRDFLSKTHIQSLKNCQDNDGNTPSHLAVNHSDFTVLELLAGDNFKANWSLKNKEGLSVDAAINRSSIKKMIMEGKASMMMTEETCQIVELGDLFTLQEHVEKIGLVRFYKSHDSNGRNVIHKLLLVIRMGCIIIPKKFLDFIEDIVDDFPEYLKQPDNNGDTPIHILARLNPDKIMIHLAGDIEIQRNPNTFATSTIDLYPGPRPDHRKYFLPPYTNYNYVWESLGNTSFFTKLIDLCIENFKEDWLTQNVKGNTALHEAILATNFPVLKVLADLGEEAPTLVNKDNETVLHLLATHSMPSIADDVLADLITSNMKDNRRLLDNNGLSPIMKAIRAGNITFAKRLVSLCPDLAGLKDSDDKTFWHLLVNETKFEDSEFENSPFTEKSVLQLLETKDSKGKTPLHLAVEGRRFDLATVFLYLHGDLISKTPLTNKKELLKIQDNEGKTPAELIGELAYVPRQFQEFFGKTSNMIGIRSIWGIPSTQIKEYVNTMGVISALLTTITFTAAFTVPGGLDQEKGTPLLISDTSFKFFMVADVVAMCLSMMVLFCLLWIMATGNKSKTVVLLDFSIILLLASFYATLVTFMTGLYATTHPVKPWVAIFALVLCSTLILLMHKYLVMKILIPIGRVVLIYLDKAFKNARKLGKKFISRIEKIIRPLRSPPKSQLPTSMHNCSSSETTKELPSSFDGKRRSTSSSGDSTIDEIFQAFADTSMSFVDIHSSITDETRLDLPDIPRPFVKINRSTSSSADDTSHRSY